MWEWYAFLPFVGFALMAMQPCIAAKRARRETSYVDFTDALWGVEFPAAAEAVRALVNAPSRSAP